MIVREITLERAAPGTYYLASRPIAALDDHVSRTVRLGDLAGRLSSAGRAGVAHELTCEITWDQLAGAGVELSRSVFPYLVDTGPALFAIGGPAVLRNTVIGEFRV